MREFLSTFNWVDWVIIVGLLRGAWMGHKTGIFKELLRLMSYFVTLFCIVQYASRLVLYIQSYWPPFTGAWAEIAGGAAVGVAAFLACKLVTMIICKLVKSGEGFLYSFLGVFAGMTRWALVMSAVMMFLSQANFTLVAEDVENVSRLAPYIRPIAPTAFEYIATRVLPAAAIPT